MPKFQIIVNLSFQDVEADSLEDAENAVVETIIDTVDEEPEMVREWIKAKQVQG